ncbi:hypothetical protein FB45DRAFT_1032335 [Roridomyces roridus]|uniref:F-box domain-containing protein n=1 Tax=Roridomyces roridus TaxID=1738132 RepID=A0AAD7BH57_9AGAR|nr:hypothetical protein FB45DRAFT_1032335 [Roridomyces roridus]
MFDLDSDTPFDFDPYSDGQTLVPISALQIADTDPSPAFVASPTEDSDNMPSSWKGKGVASLPVPIPAATASDPHDVFDNVGPSSSRNLRDFPSFSSAFSRDEEFVQGSSWKGKASSTSVELDQSTSKGKGKEIEQPPSLPPLTFSPTEFGYGQTTWPSPTTDEVAGPSSYRSVATPSSFGSLAPLDLIVPPAPPAPAITTTTPPAFAHSIAHRRSLPTLTVSSTRSKFRTKSSTLARKLLFKKYDGDSCPTPPSSPTDGNTLVDVGAGSCFAPWRNDSTMALEYGSLPLKGPTNLSPFPTSAFDLIPAVSYDFFEPILVVVRNHFDDMLPRELQLHTTLVRLGRETWTVGKASSSRNKWVGHDKALRELVRLSRVSKSWQELVFDGQIWANLDLYAFPLLPKSLLVRIARAAGGFVQNLNAAGHVNLHSGTLIEVADNLSVRSGSLPFTHLTGINLRGCSAITSRSLHHLLMQSPSLERLCLKGLTAVTNSTCDMIGVYCTQLAVLDLGRCPNMDAGGIRSLARTAEARGEHLQLKELRLSGLKHVDDNTMTALGRAAPYLEVLDLSHVRQLHNTAVEAFVACNDDDEEDEENGFRIICLNARQAGRSIDESNRYRRRVTRLRHLCLSSCVLLTDTACSHLAFSVPDLEYLELAGIGSSIEDDGLIRLLNTTPHLKRLDLEDASAISDAVLATLTPAPPEDQDADAPLPPESPLEHLVISGALELSDESLLALIRGCPRLKVLEADNTRMGPAVLKAFIRAGRRRAIADAKLVAIDCRGFGEGLMKDLSIQTRPRCGWRAYGVRGLGYLDGRDSSAAEDCKVGQDECDPARIVVKTFYGWQTVDAVQAAREKRRKARTRRAANESNTSVTSTDLDESGGRSNGSTRWWSPGGRRSGASSPPAIPESESCIVM